MKKLFMVLAATVICGACVFTSCKKQDNLNLEEKIIGKWIYADIDGQSAPTDEKFVYTFVSPTKGYMSASINKGIGPWNAKTEMDVTINGNKVTLSHTDGHLDAVEEYTVTAINDNEFTANQRITLSVDGSEVLSKEQIVRFVRLTVDYAEPILGLWECQELTGIETYNDANARLEFFEDGNYNYWRKNDNGEWEAVTDREFQNYFVDGTLLATRWKNIGEDELREWWEIASLADSQMQWTALRQNADGTNAQQGMRWVKVSQ